MTPHSKALREHIALVFANWDGPFDPNDAEARKVAEQRADHFIMKSAEITAAKKTRKPSLRLVQ